MQTAQPNLFTRDDTFFGVCQALGDDLGFSPNILRVVFPVLLFVNPVAAVGGYIAAGMLVATSRYLFPAPRSATKVEADDGVQAHVEKQIELLPLAA